MSDQPWALVTGASSGIGSATALALSQRGWRVILVGRNSDRLRDVSARLPRSSEVFTANLSEENDVERLIVDLRAHPDLARHGLKALINNAGIIERAPFVETDSGHWHRQFAVNLFAPVQLTRGLWPLLKSARGARVVNVASTLGLRPLAGTAAYSAAKAALIHWTHVLALEGAADGIRCNCVSPGLVDTPIHGAVSPEAALAMDGLQPLGRVGKPEEIAAAIAYFCDPSSEWVTGSNLTIDGGISLL